MAECMECSGPMILERIFAELGQAESKTRSLVLIITDLPSAQHVREALSPAGGQEAPILLPARDLDEIVRLYG